MIIISVSETEMVKDTKSWPLFNRMDNTAIAHNLVDF